MLLIDWQIVVMIIALSVAVIAVFISIANQKKIHTSFEKVEEYIEQRVGKEEQQPSSSPQERLSSADALIQKQHDQLLQHLISLSKLAVEGKGEKENKTLNYFTDPGIRDRIAQIIAQKVLDEIKKKW